MLEFVICPTCGMHLGALYNAFSIIKTERYRAVLKENKDKISVSNVNLIDHIPLSMADVFDDLYISNICCRQVMTTNSTFPDAKYH